MDQNKLPPIPFTTNITELWMSEALQPMRWPLHVFFASRRPVAKGLELRCHAAAFQEIIKLRATSDYN